MININLGEGLDDLKFGMTKDQVTLLLGEPTETETENIDGNTIQTFHYDDREVSLIFDESADFRLVTIASNNQDIRLKERSMIGLSESKLLSELEEMGFDDISDEHFEKSGSENMYSSDEYGISFYIDEGEVTEIIWTTDIDEEGNIVWP